MTSRPSTEATIISSTDGPAFADLRSPSVVLATWGGMGLVPIAPGTFGSLGALPLVYFTQALPFWQQCAGMLALALLGWVVSSRVDRRWGGHDHGEIVIDEVVGQWLTIALPVQLLSGWIPDAWFYVAGFVLFRCFDIIKPFPVSWCDRQLAGGLGVMADDVVAGIMAAGTLCAASLIWVV